MVFSLIEQRQLHLTAVCLLRDYLTPENHQELLAEASHKTKWQIEEFLARRFPRPDVESRVRKLPAPRPTASPGAAPVVMPGPAEPSLPEQAVELAIERPVPLQGAPAAPAASSGPRRSAPVPVRVEPLSEARYRIQLNASAALKEKLDLLRALTSHSNPSGDIALVIERALDLALEKVQKQRFAKTDRPRAARQTLAHAKLDGVKSKRIMPAGAANTAPWRDHVPNAVLREIAERDGLQCSYRSAEGCRCAARAFLQVHHEQPWARSGEETVENLRLLCASHNQLLAERDFGARHVELRQSERRRQSVRTDP